MLAELAPTATLVGSPTARLAPPAPLRHGLAAYRESSADLDIVPMPWQETAATYVTATGADGHLLYRDIAIVVGRQNGKTTLTKPLIVARLKAGRHIMHIAQVRELPRIMFEAIADAIENTDPTLFPKRRGKIIWPRRGAGSESIVLTSGGTYRIAAAISGSARGHSIDDLLIDELREMDSFDVLNSAKPAQRFSEDPQTIYLSNAGTDKSVVLNSLRERAIADDPNLAYLEWSADPAYAADDRRGWVQANPSIGHFPQVLDDLEKDYVAAKLGGNMAGFETEALCRWVPTMRERLVGEAAWMLRRVETQRRPKRPYLAVSMDPGGRRVSAVLAWAEGRTVALRQVFEATGSPVPLADVSEELRTIAQRLHVQEVGYDPMTDAELAKSFTKATSITGMAFANATSTFVNRVDSGQLSWMEGDIITDDLTWTARKMHDETGRFVAVRSIDERPVTASLAAIRAVWLASDHASSPPRIY